MFTFLSKRKKKEKKKKKKNLISSTVLKTNFLDQWMKDNLIIPMKGILWPVNALQYHSETTKKKKKVFNQYTTKKKKRSPLV